MHVATSGEKDLKGTYTNDYVESVSDIDLDFDCDDDIVGEAVYDEDYLRRKWYKTSLSKHNDEFLKRYTMTLPETAALPSV
jgi:hypothetical protein